MYADIQLLHERGYNITIGYVDVTDGDGELLKETFDVDHMSLPCIRLVKDGRFHEMVFFQKECMEFLDEYMLVKSTGSNAKEDSQAQVHLVKKIGYNK